MTNPLDGVGLLFHTEGPARSGFLGTCFAFRQPTHYLTAAHCVGNLQANGVGIGLRVSASADPHPVKEIIRHPSADLAILVLEEAPSPHMEVFWNFVSNFAWGEEFMAFGFPEDVFGAGGAQPTARLFKGHYQRFMLHRSEVFPQFEYNAGEMSIGAPAGLSGGPVFRPGAPQMVTGLVTENHQSTTFLQAVEDHQDGPMRSRSSIHEVIQYGVSLLLDSHAEFLDQQIPAHSGE